MLHASVRLILWGGAVTLTQLSPLPPLLAIAGGLALLALTTARSRAGRLMRRARALLLPLVILFAFFTPGTALIPEFGAMSPTAEGVRLALLHGLRLVAVVLAAALLLEHTRRDELVAGLCGLLRPLRVLGIDHGRVAVRLMLVLHYIERPEGLKDWREWIRPGACSSAEEELTFTVRSVPLSALDYLALAGVALILLGVPYA